MVKRFLVALLLLLGAGTLAFAEVPALKGRVNDYANVLSSAQVDKLSKQIETFDKRPDHPQIAVLLVESIPDGDIAGYANSVFHEWKLGAKGADNGLLFVLGIKDHKIRIEVGYGLEGSIPDGTAALIIEKMKPALKKSDFAEALKIGITEVMQKADPASVTTENEGGKNAALIFWIVLIIIVVLILMCIFLGPSATADLLSGLAGAIVGGVASAAFDGGGGDSGGGGASGDW